MLDMMSIIQVVNMILKPHEMYHLEKQMSSAVSLDTYMCIPQILAIKISVTLRNQSQQLISKWFTEVQIINIISDNCKTG